MEVERSLQKLVLEHQGLNPSEVPELEDCPTSLSFSRNVSLNRPFVVRRYGQDQRIPAVSCAKRRWTNEYLLEKAGETVVQVAVSPNGRADAIIDDEFFVEPMYEQMQFSHFMSLLRNPSSPSPSQTHRPSDSLESTGTSKVPDSRSSFGDSTTEDLPAHYLQTQNSNLTGELAVLRDDVGPDVPFASEALGKPPDALNIWIGDSRSVTSLHKDPYENIYLVIRGSKTFTIYPPTEFYCMHESRYKPARWIRSEEDGTWRIEPTAPQTSSTSPFSPSSPATETTVPWIPIDPLLPREILESDFPRYRFSRPMTITLQAGDLLYLPCLWFHHVSQGSVGGGRTGETFSTSESVSDDITVAVNWWYDLDFESPTWSLLSFVRRMTLSLDGAKDDGDDEDWNVEHASDGASS